MIATINPAFEFLRQHKQVSEETEALVMKRAKGRISQDEMISAFENGITGQYGKVYAIDPQTLLGWVEAYQRSKNTSQSYLASGLINVHDKAFDRSNDDWMKEANKCFTAFLNGTPDSNFHPCVYDFMMLDRKIEFNECMKYLEKQASGDYDPALVMKAKQRVLSDKFRQFKNKGWTQIYIIK